ncbi:Quinone oxidoreductase 1 [Crateriforma conspicua]|uniref:Quinone oxidoreductase 1 n=1 Tax=Crateriforma conspicua TaxID=2527996 RepID=A0A5C6G239_9PLAN|nr:MULTISPECIES: NADPH:quinone reductase [Crateriforma]TWU67253.1 Quinone oxidoreductase 1 [Crateriforma conspicua]
MKAACVRRTGAPDVIQIEDVPSPQAAPGQIVIDVEAASVNPIDTYVRSGVIAAELPDPYFPGCDAAGTVAALGDGVKDFNVGDRVWCTNQGLVGRQGTFAQQIAVDAQWCYPTPDSVTSDEIASVALVGITAHLGLFREAHLEPGETVLVIGGSGGVGSMVVQMAKIAGATVITTAGSDEKAQRAADYGADVVINYQKQSITEAVMQAAPAGVNVMWETRREPDFDAAVGMLAERGRMVLMAGRDARPEFPVGPFYVKECSLHGFVMFKGTPLELRKAADQINQWMDDGRLKANIGATFPLQQAADAHRLQEEATLHGKGNLTGKIVVKV